MADDKIIRRVRSWYVTLLRLYPKQYRERFGEPMEQTFSDLLRERAAKNDRLFGYTLWLFMETFVGICSENLRVMTMQNFAQGLMKNSYRSAVCVAVAAVLLLLWFYGAVAEEGDSPGPFFFASITILLIGTLIARLEPQRMVKVLFAAAIAQMLFAAFAMIAWGQHVEVLVFNAFFSALWMGSAFLFRRAGHLRSNLE